MATMKRGAEGLLTRAKVKKGRHGGLESAQEIYRRIGSSGIISPEDQVRLFHLDMPVCQGCRVNTKDNPNCFCGIIPPPNSARKQGLWQKVPEGVAELGADPSEILRSSVDPIGLANLGATCYVNCVLQCLYMNAAFRKGVFSIEPELHQKHPVLHQLGKLFAELQVGVRSFVDPTEFASTLQLDSGVQQDGQEFMKLLLSLLETVLEESNNSAVRNLVQDLFRGTFSYVTRCMQCGRESDSSKQIVAFYELEVNVQGFSSLIESLDDYLSEEKLEGDNQYSCEYCQARTDATRAVKLRTLPPMVNFQLKRFVFNSKTATKKKVTSRFSFPLSLDLSLRAINDGGSVEERPDICGLKGAKKMAWYDLTAILVHKGSMATSGHYVAHIKDDSGQWWQFDDEVVASLGCHPLGESAGCSSTSTHLENGITVLDDGGGDRDQEIDARETKIHRKPSGSSTLEENAGGEWGPQGLGVRNGDPHVLTSADAYMLIYNRRDIQGQRGGAASDQRQSCKNNNEDADIDALRTQQIPSHLLQEVNEKNAEFRAACQQYSETRIAEKQRVEERREQVRQVLAMAPVGEKDQASFWIALQWLKAWADDSKPPGEIDNTALCCRHKSFPPKNVVIAKRISEAAWNQLHSQYAGGPVLSMDSCCVDCTLEDANSALSADYFRDERSAIRHQLERNLAGLALDGMQYLCSKNWVNQWLRRKNVDGVGSVDAGPTAALRCPHGDLLPEQAPGARRMVVSECVWEYFARRAAEVAGADSQDRMEFPLGTDDCPICDKELSSEVSKRQGLRATKMEQKQRHESLFLGRPTPLLPGEQYHLVPCHWLNSWRAYITATSGKNVSSFPAPTGLWDALHASCCPEHHGLLWRPPELIFKRNEIVQRSIQDDYFTLVRTVDWEGLCEEWDEQQDKSFVAHLAGSDGGRAAAGCLFCLTDIEESNGKERLIDYELQEFKANSGSACTERRDTAALVKVPQLITHPEVCLPCMSQRESQELAQLLDYTNGEITIELAKGKEPPPSVVAASGVAHDKERRSKRVRKASAMTGGRIVLNVSGETTVYALKMQIWEAFNVIRENQRLGCGEMELGDENARLADLNILPGSRLWVVDTGQHEQRDIADDLATLEETTANPEEGFKGTGLVGGLGTSLKAREEAHKESTLEKDSRGSDDDGAMTRDLERASTGKVAILDAHAGGDVPVGTWGPDHVDRNPENPEELGLGLDKDGNRTGSAQDEANSILKARGADVLVVGR